MSSSGGGILSGPAIAAGVQNGSIIIEPFADVQLNPASYDLRLGASVKRFDWRGRLDPRQARTCGPAAVEDVPVHMAIPILDGSNASLIDGYVDLEPGVGYLMHTLEVVGAVDHVPVVDGKSSLGRLFISVHCTAGYGDPGFRGQFTLEVTVVHPTRLWIGMPIAQVRFHTVVGDRQLYDGNYRGATAQGAQASRISEWFGKPRNPKPPFTDKP